MEINYVNNSSDTINELVFRLDLNAWQKDSYLDRRLMVVGDSSVHQLADDRRGYIHIDSLLAFGIPIDSADMHYDNTILRAKLPAPVAPGQLVYLLSAFEARLPMENTPKARYWQFDDWYPRICLRTDSGWIAEQYLRWNNPPTAIADYNVLLSIDPSYEIAFAGQLMNERELYGFLPEPNDDSVYLDITNRHNTGILNGQFSPEYDKGKKEYAVISTDRSLFSFAVAPSFKRDRAYAGHTTIETCYHDYKKMMWADSVARWSRDLVREYESKLGPFPYDRLEIVGADTSEPSQPDPRFVVLPRKMKKEPLKAALAIYIASSWFPRTDVSEHNESRFFNRGLDYYAALIQMSEEYGVEGTGMMEKYEDWMKSKSVVSKMYRNDRVMFNPYLPAPPVKDNVLRDDVHLLRQYPAYVLRKVPSMLYMLRFIVGDSTMWRSFKILADARINDSVSPGAFESMVDSLAGRQLDWFWAAFADSATSYDLGIYSAHSKKADSEYDVTYRLANRGNLILPVELGFVTEGNDTLYDTLARDAFVSDDSMFVFHKKLPGRPIAIIVDPHHYLLDTNRFDNYHFFLPIRFKYQDPPDLFIGFRKL